MKKLTLILSILLLIYSSLVTYKLHQQKPQVQILTDTIRDTINYRDTIYKPKVYTIVNIEKDTIQIPTDTVELINRYRDVYSRLYASKTYIDTLKNDSIAKVVITTHLSNNSLDSLIMALKINEPKVIKTTVIDNGSKWDGGIIVGYKQFSPIVIYRYNTDFRFGIGYDIINNSPNLTILYKIK